MTDNSGVAGTKACGYDSRSALLMVNGDCSESALAHCGRLHADTLIAVDGGLRHCLALGVEPDVLIGDLDSAARPEINRLDNSNTQVLRYRAEKDQTDLELALEYAQSENIAHVTLAGLSGGRTDQMLCNWLLLGQSRWNFSIDIVDDRGCGYLVVADRSRSIAAESGATISLLSLTQMTTGVTTEGLKYPLANADLSLGSSLGISNVVCDSEFRISITRGTLLAYVNYVL